jgi:multisubunit Na+/H+ antiporter MnhB subunit
MSLTRDGIAALLGSFSILIALCLRRWKYNRQGFIGFRDVLTILLAGIGLVPAGLCLAYPFLDKKPELTDHAIYIFVAGVALVGVVVFAIVDAARRN